MGKRYSNDLYLDLMRNNALKQGLLIIIHSLKLRIKLNKDAQKVGPACGLDKVTFDISVDFLFRVKILKTLEDFSQDRGDLRLIQSTWFQLEDMTTGKYGLNSKRWHKCYIVLEQWTMNEDRLTKSRADPPPKYSIIIHNFVPWKVKQILATQSRLWS